MLKKEKGLHFLELSGKNFYDIGFQHGSVCRPLIKRCIEKSEQYYIKKFAMSYRDFANEFCCKKSLIGDTEKYAPDCYDEMRGIADGAGITLEELFLHNAADDVIGFITDKKAAGKIAGHCTSLGAAQSANQPCLLAHSSDTGSLYDGAQLVLKINYPERELRILTMTYAGIVCQSGISNRPLAVTVNTLPTLNYGAGGLMAAIICRQILTKNSIDEAVEWLKSVPRSFGQNYCLADRQQVVSLEASKNKVVSSSHTEQENFIVRANHHTFSDDYSTDSILYKKFSESMQPQHESIGRTRERYQLGKRLLSDKPDNFAVDDYKQALSTAPIKNNCVRQDLITLCGIIMALTDNPAIYVAGKLPQVDDFIELAFDTPF